MRGGAGREGAGMEMFGCSCFSVAFSGDLRAGCRTKGQTREVEHGTKVKLNCGVNDWEATCRLIRAALNMYDSLSYGDFEEGRAAICLTSKRPGAENSGVIGRKDS
jgi:hypothetical protein